MKEKYTQAFEQALNCNKKDFLIKPMYKGHKKTPMIAKYRERTYEILSSEDLSIKAEEHLTGDFGMYLDCNTVNVVMEEVHVHVEFHQNLLAKIHDKGERNQLSLILGIHNATSDANFWELLQQYMDPLSYAAAIHAATETYDNLEGLKSDLVEEWIVNGKDLLSAHVNGVFEETILYENTDREEAFYVYDSDFDYEDL